MTTFDQQITLALRPEAAPDGLREALLAAARTRKAARRGPQIWAAAGLMALLGAGSFLWLRREGGAEGSRFAQAALRNHMEVQRLDFVATSGDPSSCLGQCHCRAWSPGAVGFCAELPALLADQPLKGGRACRVAGRRVAFYLLQDGRAVYVFDRPFRDLAPAPNPAPMAVAGGLQARAWNEGNLGYVLVDSPGR